MRCERITLRNIFLIVIGILIAFVDAILVYYLYSEFPENMLSSKGAMLGVFVSLVMIGVLFPSLLFIYVYIQKKCEI